MWGKQMRKTNLGLSIILVSVMIFGCADKRVKPVDLVIESAFTAEDETDEETSDEETSDEETNSAETNSAETNSDVEPDLAGPYSQMTGPIRAVLAGGNKKISAEEDTAIEESSVGIENNAGTENTIGADIRSGYFKMDGEVYKLPMNCQDFIARGWVFADPAYAGQELAPGDIREYISLKKGNAMIRVTIGNIGEQRGLITNLPVISVSIEQEIIKNSGMIIELPQGIILSQVKLNDITAVYGDVDRSELSGPSTGTHTVFVYGSAGAAEVLFSTTEQDLNRIKEIQIRDYTELDRKRQQLIAAGQDNGAAAPTPEADIPVPEAEVPIPEKAAPTPEVAAYKVPTALGTDITSRIIEFGGDLYQLPAPVSAFEKNGWDLEVTFPSEVDPGESAHVGLSRGNQSITLFVTNMGKERTAHSNCFLDSIGTGELPFKLPAGIQVGSSREEVLAAIKDKRYEYEAESYYQTDRYRVFVENGNRFIEFDISNVTNKVEIFHITIGNPN